MRGIKYMIIDKKTDGNDLKISIEGRLDAATAPKLEAELMGSLDGIDMLTFDFAKLEYISSAGLRTLLAAQKIMNKLGSMAIINASDEVKEIFDVTGFSEIMTVE